MGGLLSAACGSADGEPTAADPADGPVAPVQVRPAVSGSAIPEEPEGEGDTEGAGVGNVPVTGQGGSGAQEEPPVVVEPADPDEPYCGTPNGVNGSPRTLEQAIILLNSLPRPTSMACFLESLERPLNLYMTSSGQSLQPSPGPRSPRSFIVNEPLVMSIVFDGPGQGALELGLRTAPRRSIKTEILFPITKDVTAQNFFDEVMNGEATRCSACHTAEIQTFTTELPVDAFESDILPPFDNLEVTIDSMRQERQNCDASLEPERCAMLGGLFDFGEVQAAPNGFMFGL